MSGLKQLTVFQEQLSSPHCPTTVHKTFFHQLSQLISKCLIFILTPLIHDVQSFGQIFTFGLQLGSGLCFHTSNTKDHLEAVWLFTRVQMNFHNCPNLLDYMKKMQLDLKWNKCIWCEYLKTATKKTYWKWDFPDNNS